MAFDESAWRGGEYPSLAAVRAVLGDAPGEMRDVTIAWHQVGLIIADLDASWLVEKSLRREISGLKELLRQFEKVKGA
jgi:hypothetical protein